jgi:hypothetical protein
LRVLLRSQTTGLYFQDDFAWTADPNNARRFAGMPEAIALAQRNHIADAEILLAFKFSGYDVSIPLGDCRRSARQ